MFCTDLHATKIQTPSINSEPTDVLLGLCKGDPNRKSIFIEESALFDFLTIDTLNGLNFNELLQNIVFKNETSVQFKDLKVFQQGLYINKYIETKYLNTIPIESLLTKYGKQHIRNPVIIHGNVNVLGDTTINGTLNNVNLDELSKVFGFDGSSYVIKGDVKFMSDVEIKQNLQVNKNVNGYNLEELLDNIVYITDVKDFENITTFKGPVVITGNLEILEAVNGIDLQDFLDDAVLITKDSTIDGDVLFENKVIIKENLNLESDLITDSFWNVDFESWKNKAVYMNRGHLPMNLTLETVIVNTNLKTNFLNSINMSSVIPKKTDSFIENLDVESANCLASIDVRSSVNEVDISEKYFNCLLIDQDDEVTSPVIFEQSVTTSKLSVGGTINSNDVKLFVTTSSDKVLSGSYNFNNVTFEKDVSIDGLMNGENFNEWRLNRVPTKSPEPQIIEQEWNVKDNISFSDVNGNGSIGDLNLGDLFNDYQEFSLEKMEIENKTKVCVQLFV